MAHAAVATRIQRRLALSAVAKGGAAQISPGRKPGEKRKTNCKRRLVLSAVAKGGATLRTCLLACFDENLRVQAQSLRISDERFQAELCNLSRH